MNGIQKLGLGIFIAALLAFTSAITWSRYTLTPELVYEQIGSEIKREALNEVADGLYGRSFTGNFRLLPP